MKIMKTTLKLSDIRKEFKFNLQKNMWNGHLRDWKDYAYKYGQKLDFDVYLPSKGKNLQRDFCWTIEQKRELINSIIKGIDIQVFSIIISENEDKSVVYKVIDGKQRLSTMIDFINDKFSIILCGQEYFYSELPNDDIKHEDIRNSIKYTIDNFYIHFNQTYEYWDDLISDDDKISWFEQINFAGTPQDIEHLNNLKS
jgi:hypothetical protein